MLAETGTVFPAPSEAVARAAFRRQFPSIIPTSVTNLGALTDPAVASKLGIQPYGPEKDGWSWFQFRWLAEQD